MRYLVLFLCIGSIAFQILAGKLHFVAPQGFNRRTILTSLCFVCAATANLVVLSHSQISLVRSSIAVGLYLGSLALLASAIKTNRDRPLSVAFTPDEPKHHVTKGPYRFIRHPFYAAYCITWLAGALASWSVLLSMIGALMVILYWRAARFEEKKFENSSMAPSYALYRSQAGMFWPLPVTILRYLKAK